MGRRLSTPARELAAAWIGMTVAKCAITTDQAARIVAESDCQNWDGLQETDRAFYRGVAHNLLERISDPPRGIPLVQNDLWELV